MLGLCGVVAVFGGWPVAELAHWMGLAPLAWLCVRAARGHDDRELFTWLAFAFAISWLADTMADLLPERLSVLPSFLYPIAQTGVIYLLLERRHARFAAFGAMLIVGLLDLWRFGVAAPDVLLRTAASSLVLVVAWRRRDLPWKLRLALGVYFGAGLVTWLVHVRWLVVATWYPYQAARLAGLALFCRSIGQPAAPLDVAPRRSADLAFRWFEANGT